MRRGFALACRAPWSTRAWIPRCQRRFHAALEVYRAARRDARRHRAAARGHAIPVYYLVATAEASSNLARYDGVRFGFRAPARGGPGAQDDLRTMYGRTRELGFGVEVKRRIMLGTYVLSAGYYDAYYLKAQQVRTLIRRDYEQAFEQVDVVAMPTSPTPAFRIGERVADPLQMYLADVFTVSANLAGLPAISVPCGFICRARCRSDFSSPVGCSTRATLLPRRTPTNGSTEWSRLRQPIPQPLNPTDGRRCRTSKLLDVRMCDLDLRIAGPSRAPHRAGRCGAAGVRPGVRPHYWLSEEWFTPDGVPGVAVPFYLAHPRLAKLELSQMLEVEGGDAEAA